MENGEKIPEIKQILGSLIFGASRALKISEMRKCLVEAADRDDSGEAKVFAKVKDKDIAAALKELDADIQKTNVGFFLREVAGGYMLQSDASCGKWLKVLLDKGRPDRLSRPALETLSIIAYRQPVSKAAIEAIRGVDVGHMIKNLMEMQLVKIVGRSELPGRPFLYASTNAFLEHFGLKDLKELNDMEPMLVARQEEKIKKEAKKKEEVAEASGDQEELSLDAEEDQPFMVSRNGEPQAEQVTSEPDAGSETAGEEAPAQEEDALT
jgi:segregation and condensation protein B